MVPSRPGWGHVGTIAAAWPTCRRPITPMGAMGAGRRGGSVGGAVWSGGGRVARGVWMGRSRSLVDLVVRTDRLRVLVTMLVRGGARATDGARRDANGVFSYLGNARPRGGLRAGAEGLTLPTGYGCSCAASCAYQGRGGAPARPPGGFPHARRTAVILAHASRWSLP